MRIGDTLTNPCFSAQFSLDACHREDGYLAQLMALWLEAFMWCSDSSELLSYLESRVTTSLLLMSNHWYANLSIYHVLPLEILYVCFWPMVFPVRGLDYQN
jgi:hypothetical protein